MRAVEVRVTGLVQGVFFRASMRELARENGVSGWVRNEPDGSVGAYLEGPPDAVATLLDWCQHGPAGAEVDEVGVKDVPQTGWEGFSVRRA